MPRKAFVSDLREAVNHAVSANISRLQAGEEDGTFTFTYTMPEPNDSEVTIQALVPELSDYPSDHQYLVYSTSENVPPAIQRVLEAVADSLAGLKLATMLGRIARALDKAAAASSTEGPYEDDMDVDEDEAYDSDVDSEQDDPIGGWSPRSPEHDLAGSRTSGDVKSSRSSHQPSKDFRTRIRHDLRLAKVAGFKVGHMGCLADEGRDGFISISCRIAKLGISEEAMAAWHLDRRQYVILLIHYPEGYKPFEALVGEGTANVNGRIDMRVGVSSHYKPSYSQAVAAFTQLYKKHRGLPFDHPGDFYDEKEKRFQALFISRPLNELLNKRLITLLRSRLNLGIGWGGAEAFYNDYQGKNISDSDVIDAKYWREDSPKTATTLPDLVTSDHFRETPGLGQGMSFPLLGMQFVLRHLVRCTEFCLVCHCRVEADFEALKPYVCSKPLCLYQYMSLGFGPSTEYEILSQPYVVDLLVSFCYASAGACRLKDFPVGMGLTIPAPQVNPPGILRATRTERDTTIEAAPSTDSSTPPTVTETPLTDPSGTLFQVKFDRASMDMIISDPKLRSRLKLGDWIRLNVPGARREEAALHSRIIDMACFPTVRLGPPVIQLAGSRTSAVIPSSTKAQQPEDPELTPAPSPPPTAFQPAFLTVYSQLFDSLDDRQKCETICMLLDTLPSIMEMKEHLSGKKQNQDLADWADRISPAARGVLRWIISSNRSCILQVDDFDAGGQGKGATERSEERVYGMPQWKQFRFAQGAPDKEQRFMNSVREVAERLKPKYPTVFAWHGSGLQNWHGIVREGLHFKETAHGRSYGHGCYHAMDAMTSLTYSGIHHGIGLIGSSPVWPQSLLKVSGAIALNEIVNAPGEFVSSSPYLVVSQLDWIQTRFLFVKCHSSDTATRPDVMPAQAYDQDPAYTPRGANNQNIVIPVTAVSKSRRPLVESVKARYKQMSVSRNLKPKKRKSFEDTTESVATDAEDAAILLSDIEEARMESASNGAERDGSTAPGALTDFVPGKLDHSTLPILEPPVYASTAASTALQSRLRSAIQAQKTQPLHELGWYIDPELVSNVYQWIVELHSFEPHLPLAKDLKAKGLRSVVMEVRFGPNFPFSPPFVRVIRPRFVSFMAGGGGHVTAGGALCMELLTNSGWSSASSLESVFLQVRLAMSSVEPSPARLEPGPVQDYGVGEAVHAYMRACKAHGWGIPSDFAAFQAGAGGLLN